MYYSVVLKGKYFYVKKKQKSNYREVIFRPRYPRPSVRAIRKCCRPSVRSLEKIAFRAYALLRKLPSERTLFLNKFPSERDLKKW